LYHESRYMKTVVTVSLATISFMEIYVMQESTVYRNLWMWFFRENKCEEKRNFSKKLLREKVRIKRKKCRENTILVWKIQDN